MRDGAETRGNVLVEHPSTSAACPELGGWGMLEFCRVFVEQAGFQVLQLTFRVWTHLSPNDV